MTDLLIAFKNIIKMLEQRKRLKTITGDIVYTQQDFSGIGREELKDLLNITVDKELLVVFNNGSKLGIGLTKYIETMNEMNIKDLIVVVDMSVTPDCKKTISNLITIGYNIEIFTIGEFQYDIFENRLVPKYHEILSKKSRESLLQNYGARIMHLPKLLSTDPVCKRLGLKKGQIILLERASDTMKNKTEMFYRVVA